LLSVTENHLCCIRYFYASGLFHVWLKLGGGGPIGI
jgi:hypothetical protein